ncbi:MFS transporter [Sodalis sp. (in: enterobacteria)]|uniref:MFS transporter n=1 Tax=Sodalis sp. (in: enterobacteria) TaxID=1898979 RepID=UPI003F32012A
MLMDNVSELETTTLRKVALRLMPLLTLGYFLASLDRVNVGFAALQMNDDVGLSAAAFGLGAGLFFVAYCFFAVPCNVMMVKVGARRWLSLVMVAWGVISSAMALVQGPWSFYVLRFLLGIAEAGFFPGVIYFFTLWFPRTVRGRMVAILMMALPLSSVLGSPVSAALLLTDGVLQLRGWHWLFIIEGIPAVALGLLALLILPRDVQSARWLTAPQRDWLTRELREPEAAALPREPLWRQLFNKQVLLLTLVYMGGTAVTNGLSLWQPQMIKSFHMSTMQIGLLNAIPFAIASLAMYLWGAHSDKHCERTWHTCLPLLLGAAGLAGTMWVSTLGPTIAVLCVAIIAASMIKGPFWAMATEQLPAQTAAVAIGQINALNNLGVFAGTWLIGTIRTATDSFSYALAPLVALSLAASLAAWYLGRRRPVTQPLNAK